MRLQLKPVNASCWMSVTGLQAKPGQSACHLAALPGLLLRTPSPEKGHTQHLKGQQRKKTIHVRWESMRTSHDQPAVNISLTGAGNDDELRQVSGLLRRHVYLRLQRQYSPAPVGCRELCHSNACMPGLSVPSVSLQSHSNSFGGSAQWANRPQKMISGSTTLVAMHRAAIVLNAINLQDLAHSEWPTAGRISHMLVPQFGLVPQSGRAYFGICLHLFLSVC